VAFSCKSNCLFVATIDQCLARFVPATRHARAVQSLTSRADVSTAPGANQERKMKIRVKPAVFTGDRVTRDMLMLALQALVVGAAAAMLSGLVVAAVVALL
jgi:hypothetical protein